VDLTNTDSWSEDAAITYRYIRVGLVALTVFLLVSLAITAAKACAPGSISAFFYTKTHAVLIAALCAMGICLIAYKGSRLGEDSLLNFSGFLAFVVALIPTHADNLCEPWLPTTGTALDAVANNLIALVAATAAGAALYLTFQRKPRPRPDRGLQALPDCTAGDGWARVANTLLRIEPALPWVLPAIIVIGALLLLSGTTPLDPHTAAAYAMFLGITLVVVYYAVYARGWENTPGRRKLAKFYAGTAVVMLATVGLAIVFAAVDVEYGVLLVELLMIIEFGVFWAVQTWDVWYPGDKYPSQTLNNVAGTPAR